MLTLKPGLTNRIHGFLGGFRGHDCPDDRGALLRGWGSFPGLSRIGSLQSGFEPVPHRCLRRPACILTRSWPLQVGNNAGEPVSSAGTHVRELDRDSAAVTKRSYQCHGAKDPGVDFDQNLGPGSEVEWRCGFHVFDAASSQTQVAQPAFEQGAVQGETCDLRMTAAGVARHATTINASGDFCRRCLLAHAFLMLPGKEPRTNG
jgi:hypothetical protein